MNWKKSFFKEIEVWERKILGVVKTTPNILYGFFICYN